MPFNLGIGEVLVVLIVALLVFGGRLPEGSESRTVESSGLDLEAVRLELGRQFPSPLFFPTDKAN